MNFRQAYDGWSQQEENRQLFMKTKEAFRKAWFTLPTNKPCSYYTKEVLGKALSETRVVDSMKVNAASIAVHILNWAAWAEPKWNPKPDFTMDDLMEYARRPKVAEEVEEPVIKEPSPTPAPPAGKEEPEQVDKDDTDLDIDPVTALPRKAMAQEDFCKGCNNVKGCITCHNGSEWARIIPEGDHQQLLDAIKVAAERILDNKPKDDMSNEKKRSGRAPIPVAQLDPDTLQVVKVWPSRCEAERGTGACNIDRTIEKHRKAAGFFWCKPEDADGFEPSKGNRNDDAAAKPKPAPVRKTRSVTAKNLEQEAGSGGNADTQKKGLAGYTDDELKQELIRRGWRGRLSRVEELLLE